MRRLKRFFAREDGAAAIEFGIIGLVFIVVSIGIVEIGRALFLRNELSYLADCAARAILLDPTVSDANLEAEVMSSRIGLSNDLDPVFGMEDVGGVTFRTIKIQYPFTLLIPGLTNNEPTLSVVRRVPGAASDDSQEAKAEELMVCA